LKRAVAKLRLLPVNARFQRLNEKSVADLFCNTEGTNVIVRTGNIDGALLDNQGLVLLSNNTAIKCPERIGFRKNGETET
jgi:hypothetical protein